VFAKRPLGTSRGRLVWREPMVWAAADTFDLVLDSALPLALYRERSVSREAALAALNNSELTWEIVYTSPSLTGVRAAALAGLAITPLPASAVVAGLRIIGWEEGLPRLPDLEFAIYEKARPEKPQRHSPQLYWRLGNRERALRSKAISERIDLMTALGHSRLIQPVLPTI
jgi:DNA-binding transcriptional LysR family regulator